MKEVKDYVNKILKDPRLMLESVKGDFIMDVTERICEILEKEGIDRKELAIRMGKSKGYISQLLNGTRNMTLGTLAEILYHLGYKVTIKCEKRKRPEIIKEEVEFEPGEIEIENFNYNLHSKAA